MSRSSHPESTLCTRTLGFFVLALTSFQPIQAGPNDTPEPAPIVEHKLDVFDFTLKTAGGQSFNLRDYARSKRLVIVAFVAGWCPNSNRNGHVLKRLYDKYHQRGLGVVVVMEYSDSREIATHIARIGIDYPVVVEKSRRGERKESQHYKYRKKVNDQRKWGTPFYILIDSRDVQAASHQPLLAQRVWTVSGEIVESEAEAFLEKRLAP